MDATTAAYIAGFFDGEGYITIRRSNRYLGNRVSYRLVVGFTNTNIDVLKWIQLSVGGGAINPKSRKSLKHSQAFELTVHKRHLIVDLIDAIEPYVRIKREQLAVGVCFLSLGLVQKIMVVSRGNKSWPVFRAKPGENEIREDYKLIMTDLNRRGPRCLQ